MIANPGFCAKRGLRCCEWEGAVVDEVSGGGGGGAGHGAGAGGQVIDGQGKLRQVGWTQGNSEKGQ